MKPFFSLSNVHLSIPGKETPLLENVSLDIYLGDFIILLGSNGSGKSSLMKAINGLSPPTSGSIFFEGSNITKQPIHKRAKSIVTLTQDLNLSTFSNLTVLENCLIALQRKKSTFFSAPLKNKKDTIESHLSRYSAKLVEKIDTLTSSLSGGERQTLALAMSLYTPPSLLLLDEHTSALDPAMASKLMEITSNATQDQCIPTVMTTHNIDHALSYGNRLIVMHKGQLLHDFKEEEKRNLTRNDLLGFYDPLNRNTKEKPFL